MSRLIKFRLSVFVLLVIVLSISSTKRVNAQSFAQFSTDIVRLAPVGVLTDTVNVWGAVTQRGRFLVARGTTLSELLSYTGGPGFGNQNMNMFGQNGGVFMYKMFPQVDLYLNRYNPETKKEEVVQWTYRVNEPFPEGFRNYELQNGEYVTIHVRSKPTLGQYLLFGLSLFGSLAGVIFILDRFI